MNTHFPAVSLGLLRARIAAACAWAVICAAAAQAQTISAAHPQSAAGSTIPAAAQTSTPGAALPQPAGQASSHVSSSASGGPSEASDHAGGITEEELKRLLVGKPLFLRGGYLDDTLNYSEHGLLIGGSARASYTLCGVQIEKIRLTKHKVELTGARYGLHFLGALPYEDPARAIDRVRVTPKKKSLRITIDRELVIKPKKKKEPKGAGSAAAPQQAATSAVASAEADSADAARAEIAAAAPEERPADPKSVTTTTSPAHAAMLLKAALDSIFAPGLDERMIAAMPDFWKLYYQAAASKTDYRPSDPAVLRQNTVDRKARLLSTFEPGSNQYAQDNGVAGMSLYHVVIGSDGKPGEIAVARPIGFGLDEGAVQAIREAKFEPALKDGKPVPVLLDLVVQFRIYSKRTAVASGPGASSQESGQALPGPYSVQQ